MTRTVVLSVGQRLYHLWLPRPVPPETEWFRPWMTWCHRNAGGAWMEIDTDSPEFLALAWRRAADAVARTPPACPRLPDDVPNDALLRALWPDWIRIVTNLARRYPADMESWVNDFRADTEFEMATAVDSVFRRWERDYPKDLAALIRRVVRELEPRGMTFGLSGREPRYTRDLVPTSLKGLAALLRVFAWRADASADARPGLLESRWIHWPLVGEVELAIHLSPAPAPPVPPRPPRPRARNARPPRR